MPLANWAIFGAAPVPVPPPIPAATNTMSAPCNTASKSSRLSSAALAPISGLAAGAQALGALVADMDGRRRGRAHQLLGVGIHRNEVNAPDLRLDHAVNGVADRPPPTPTTLMSAY